MLALGANGRGRAGLLSALRPQDVFATSLYTATGNAQSVTTGFAPDLVWDKQRNGAAQHGLVDTVRGGGKYLVSSSTAAEATYAGYNVSGPNGFSIPAGLYANGNTLAAWSFRRVSKFFDIVTYTGDGTSGRVIPHALGIKPGMIIVKRRDAAGSWNAYHVSTGAGSVLFLNATNASTSGATQWGNTEPTAIGFTVQSDGGTNAAGVTYVAYLIAHDPDTTNGIVQCGSFTTNASGQASVTLGWQPQWLLFKRSDGVGGWLILDTTRGWGAGADAVLYPNLSDAEGSVDYQAPNSTGFSLINLAASAAHVFLAIRAPI